MGWAEDNDDAEQVSQAEDVCREQDRESWYKWWSGAKQRYLTAKSNKTGTQCACPSCGKSFNKKSYQQAFCSNKGQDNCKDRYWNRATDSRLERALVFSGNDTYDHIMNLDQE